MLNEILWRPLQFYFSLPLYTSRAKLPSRIGKHGEVRKNVNQNLDNQIAVNETGPFV